MGLVLRSSDGIGRSPPACACARACRGGSAAVAAVSVSELPLPLCGLAAPADMVRKPALPSLPRIAAGSVTRLAVPPSSLCSSAC